MEKKKITEEIRKQLREPLPPEAISPHPTKAYLSTIKAIYVVERLNDVFGIGRWNLVTNIVQETDDYVLMKGKLKILDYDVEVPMQYGGHTTTGKNTEIADGYKSATTDCLSKCASYLEIGLDVFKGKVTTTGETKPTKTDDGQNPADYRCSICNGIGALSKAGNIYCSGFRKHQGERGTMHHKDNMPSKEAKDEKAEEFFDDMGDPC